MKRSDNIVKCLQCSVTFHAAPSLNRKFCSKACHDHFLIGKPSKKPGSITVVCEQCHVSFKSPQSNKRRFCSTSCFDDSRRKPKVDRECKQCSAPFQSFPSDATAQFCSPACKKLFIRGDRAAKWVPNDVRTCGQCGQSFERKPWQKARFCSRKCRNQWLRTNIISPTGIEIIIEKALTNMGIVFEPQAQIEQWSCDFFIPSERLVIECDGDYWHSLPKVQYKDMVKDRWLQENGYRVLHLSENAINNQLDECKERIMSALLFAAPL